jgi:glycosyltransferase involved in cell wall biosynthesis
MDSPRICILTETYYPVIGGGETQARLLAEGLVSKGISVFIVTRRSSADLRREEEYGPVKVYRLPPVGSGQLRKWGLLITSFFKLVQLRNQYDLLFVSGFRIVGVSAVLVSKLFGKACVLKADSQGEMSGDYFQAGLAKVGMGLSSPLFKLFLKLRNSVLRRASAFTVITNDIAVELFDTRVRPEIIHTIPNSVDTNIFFPVDTLRKRELRRELEIPPLNKIVIYTGRLVSYKGLPLLLKVWQEILKKHDNVNLFLLGTGGFDIHNCEDDLKAYVAENNMEHSVYFTGSVNDVPKYLQASDIFAFPTENDAFPSSLIEAMTCELAVIATPVGAIETIIENEKNGLLVMPGDSWQLYDALDRLISDNDLINRLGKMGSSTVYERYSADIVVDQYINLFRSISN